MNSILLVLRKRRQLFINVYTVQLYLYGGAK